MGHRSQDYEDIYEEEDEEEVLSKVRDNVETGDCPSCGGKNSMHLEENLYFHCELCDCTISKESYYRIINRTGRVGEYPILNEILLREAKILSDIIWRGLPLQPSSL